MESAFQHFPPNQLFYYFFYAIQIQLGTQQYALQVLLILIYLVLYLYFLKTDHSYCIYRVLGYKNLLKP